MSDNITRSAEEPGVPNYSRIASPIHTLLVLAAEVGLAYRAIHRLSQLQSTTDRIQLYERTIFFQLLMFALVLVGVRLHGSSLASVLGERWRSMVEVLRDAGIGVVFFFASTILGSALGGHGGGQDRSVLFLLPQTGMEAGMWIVVSLTAGVCEEAVYRGYLQRQFMVLTKNVPIGIVLSADCSGGD